MAVRADGDCCFHLCGVLGELMRDPDAVQRGSTACCPLTTQAARDRILANITEYVDLVKSTCVEPSEVEGAILENYGELPSSYIPRVTGTAKEAGRLGLINDFAAFTAKTPFQVMVIDTRDIWLDSSDTDLHRAVRKAEIRTDTEFVKRVFCVVLHKRHYDLGVVRREGSVQAVFAAGVEFDTALGLILVFVKSRSPIRGGERGDLCPRWVPPAPVPAPASGSRAEAPSLSTQYTTHNTQSTSHNTKHYVSPPPFLSSSLSPVASVFVPPSLVVGGEKYTSHSVGPIYHSPIHQTGI